MKVNQLSGKSPEHFYTTCANSDAPLGIRPTTVRTKMTFWRKEMPAQEPQPTAVSRLQETIERLEKRVAQLETDCAPFRVGPWPYAGSYYYEMPDPRPRVSLHDAAEKIMAHCGLSFDRVPPVAEKIVVKAAKRPK